MSSSSKRLVAVIAVFLSVIFIARGLDRLPAKVHQDIAAERSALSAAQQHLQQERGQVAAQVQSDAELFNAVPFGKQWPDRFTQADAELSTAGRRMDDLLQLEKRNRHSDTHQAETLIQTERDLRARALKDADGLEAETAHWIDARRHLPEQVQEMDRNYKAIHAFDFAPITAAVLHAETDWPAKKADFDARLNAQKSTVAEADKLWQDTAEDRRKAAAGDMQGVHVGPLLAASQTLATVAAEQPRRAQELQQLSGQLYNSWDKVLIDMQARGDGSSREYDQQLRTVRTHLTDVAAKTGDTTKDEQWVVVSRPTYDAMRNDLGMAIEHKSAGTYDSEAEHVAQPAGFAYMAPPSQASNQYGYWDHRDGRDFWVFYGQYALLRDLLSNHDYRPYDRYEYENYRTYQSRGQTYYGNDSGGSAPKYGSAGTSTQKSYSSSKYAQSGGFRDSQYASKSGGYRDSHYSSPSVRDPSSDHAPRSFGSGSGSRPSSPSFHPAPSRPPTRSPGRSFGGRRK